MMAKSFAKSSIALLLTLSVLTGLPVGMGSHVDGEFHIESITSHDDDGDGFLDNVTVQFSEPMDWTALPGAEDWEVSFFDEEIQTTVSAVQVLGDTALTLLLNEWAFPYTGAVETVRYVGAEGLEAADELLGFDDDAPFDTLDAAVPRALLAQLDVNDLGDDGFQPLFVLFSEEGLDDEAIASHLVLRYTGNQTVIPFATGEEDAPFEVDGVAMALPTWPLAPTGAFQAVITAGIADLAGNAAPPSTLTVTDVGVYVLDPEPDQAIALAETGTGSTTSLSVRLTIPPSDELRLRVSSSDVAEFTVDKSLLAFGPGNHSVPKVVQLSGVDDHAADGNATEQLRLQGDFPAYDLPMNYFLMGEPFYFGIELDVNVTDTTRFNFTATAPAIALSEAATSQSIPVVLTAKPATGTKVVLDVKSTDTTEAAVNRTKLTFGPGNWSTPQSVKVTGVDDAELDGMRLLNVTFRVNGTTTGRDAAFDSAFLHKVPVTVADNDTAGLVLSVLKATVAEPAGTTTVGIKLAAKPDFGTSGQVRVKATSSDAKQFTSSPANVTFGAADWNAFKTFTLTAVDDTVPDGTALATLALTVEQAHTVAAYDGMAAVSVPVNVTDNDAGLILSKTNLTVREGGPAGTYTVRLSTLPASNVVVGVAAGSGLAASPAKLTFGAGNWSVPQTVTVQAADDSLLQGNRTALVTHAIVSGPTGYAGLAASSVNATVQDDDDDAVTGASIAAANSAIVLQVARDGRSNVLDWILPSELPAPAAGVQVWRSAKDGYTLVATLPADHASFKSASYRDAAAPEDAKYLVTVYYGLAQGFGYSADGKSSAVASFDTLQAFQPSQEAAGLSAPARTLIVVSGFVVLVAVAVALGVVIGRR